MARVSLDRRVVGFALFAVLAVVGAQWIDRYRSVPLASFLAQLSGGSGLLALGYVCYRIVRLRSPVRDVPKAFVPIVFFGSLAFFSPIVEAFFPEHYLDRTVVHDVLAVVLYAFPLGLAIASARHARSVKVLFLRSFQSDADRVIVKALRRVCRYIGRTEALRPPRPVFSASKTWGLIGHPEKWREGIQKLIGKSRLVIVDVSQSSESLDWEIDQLNTQEQVPRIFIARCGSSFEVAGEDVLTYDSPHDQAFLTSLLRSIELKLNLSGPRWDRHCRRIGAEQPRSQK